MIMAKRWSVIRQDNTAAGNVMANMNWDANIKDSLICTVLYAKTVMESINKSKYNLKSREKTRTINNYF